MTHSTTNVMIHSTTKHDDTMTDSTTQSDNTLDDTI